MPTERRDTPTTTAQQDTPDQGDLPSGVARAEAADALAAAPALVDVYPLSGLLVDSLRPTLRAWAQGDSALSYQFRLCDVEAMSGTGCTSSGYLASSKNAWQVPDGKLAWGRQYWWTVTVRDSATLTTVTSPKLTFTTGVRQPLVTSLLAAQAKQGQEYDPRTGNYTTTVTDVSVPTAGLPLSVSPHLQQLGSAPRRDVRRRLVLVVGHEDRPRGAGRSSVCAVDPPGWAKGSLRRSGW
ncbi:hypothetical protein FHU36_000855 [Nonomuraea muscovyensis]|uniref:Uncharacterized protein n=1 Tax=Nonomuraea muscovyensis TaxID=1124761 RepID=A0A7X0EX69_9ACTN|nr:hypothetical protein [Nonomuraea muscovyensis]MBB6344346.1 hypothetical protein [Nonomuraea muscovyensis]